MPLATNPKALFEIVLESDKERPENEKPVFIYRYWTGLEYMEMSDFLDSVRDSKKGGRESIEKYFKITAMGLVGWKNITDVNGKSLAFAPEKIPEIMGFGEAKELALEVMSRQIPSLEDKKKSDGLSDSNMEKSARDVKDGINAPIG